jgi:predicted membrane-bound spermidine synthase
VQRATPGLDLAPLGEAPQRLEALGVGHVQNQRHLAGDPDEHPIASLLGRGVHHQVDDVAGDAKRIGRGLRDEGEERALRQLALQRLLEGGAKALHVAWLEGEVSPSPVELRRTPRRSLVEHRDGFDQELAVAREARPRAQVGGADSPHLDAVETIQCDRRPRAGLVLDRRSGCSPPAGHDDSGEGGDAGDEEASAKHRFGSSTGAAACVAGRASHDPGAYPIPSLRVEGGSAARRMALETGARAIAPARVPSAELHTRDGILRSAERENAVQMVRPLALIVTVLTGFSALVYEIAWQKYLAALLGSHSEATAAVLAIFLGALSYGYALFGRITRGLVRRAVEEGRPARLLFTYGCVELSIGVYALLFPLVFAFVRGLSLLIPGGAPAVSFAIDVALSAILIGPPALLMGSTIPLLTQALPRDVGEATRFHALVYAVNTAGSFAGALCAGFLLVPWLGLEGAVLAMGLVNLAAGLALLALGRSERESVLRGEAAANPRAPDGFFAFISVAVLSGFAVMTLQVIMNRIGALSLGASNFTFSMVVAVFVLCIALGSFAVAGARRIPPWVLPVSQWLLVGYLLLLYPFVEDAPYWAHRVRTSFQSDPEGFYEFHVSVFSGILAVFFVPLSIAGATLPLLFHHLRRQVGHLGQIAGRLYSWNTAGSLLGALLGGYALLFWLDLHHGYRLAMLALIVGASLLSVRILRRGRAIAGAVALACSVAVFALPGWSPKKLSSGLFRDRTAGSSVRAGPRAFFEQYRSGWPDDYVVFYSDDPSTSVAVNRRPISHGRTSSSLIINGKPDSAIPTDDVTTGLLGLVPAVLSEGCRRAFVIGYGTGMTVGRLVALETVEEVVVAEISQGVMEAAVQFEPYNGHVLEDPKTRIVRSDAYRALLRSEDRYDVIVSEPSNPWVTGVEMLYSRDFLQSARGRLSPGGIFVQWFHTYEMDEETIALVFETFRTVFRRNAVWYGRGPDLLILGFRDDDHSIDLEALEERWERDDFREQFALLGIHELSQLLAHELLPVGVLTEAELPRKVHTIAHPILSHQAALAFFRGEGAELPDLLSPKAISVGRRTSLLQRFDSRHGLAQGDRVAAIAETCRYRLEPCATLFAEWQSREPGSATLADLLEQARQSRDHHEVVRPALLETLALLFRPPDAGAAPLAYEEVEAAARAFPRFYHHGAPFAENALERLWAACDEDARCRERLDAARRAGTAAPIGSSGHGSLLPGR